MKMNSLHFPTRLVTILCLLGVAYFSAVPAGAETVLRIEEAVICRDVVDRAPIGSGDVW